MSLMRDDRMSLATSVKSPDQTRSQGRAICHNHSRALWIGGTIGAKFLVLAPGVTGRHFHRAVPVAVAYRDMNIESLRRSFT